MRYFPIRVAAAAVLVGVGAAMTACETAEKVGDTISRPFKDDGKHNVNLNEVATITIWDPVRKIEDPITVDIGGSGANAELRRAVKDIQNESYDEAKASLHASVARDPRNAKAFLLLGLLHEYQGNNAEAVAAYKQSNIAKSTDEAQQGRRRCETKLAPGG